MKTITPEIAWHNRDPVYSVDLQPRIQESSSDKTSSSPDKTSSSSPSSPAKWYRLATSGTDSQVVIWKVWHRKNSPSSVDIEPISQLTRHEKAVNVVRFTPTGEDLLASADVDGIIILWKLDSSNFGPSNGVSNGTTTQSKKSDGGPEIIVLSSQSDEEGKKSKKPGSRDEESEEVLPNLFEEETIKIEVWNQWKTLRGHLEDVVDISWSSDGNTLVSASVDNEAIVWDAVKGVKLHMLTGHKSWVQGVSFDPLNEHLVTLGADRNLRVYSCSSRKFLYKVDKGSVLQGEDSFVKTRLFYDYTLPSFTRRLAYSPGGEFLLAPSGVIEFPKKVAVSNGDQIVTNGDQIVTNGDQIVTNGDGTVTNGDGTVSNGDHPQNGDENSGVKESDVVELDEENDEGVEDVEMAEEEEGEEQMDADDESDEKEDSNEGSVKSGESNKSGEENEQRCDQAKSGNGQREGMDELAKRVKILTKRTPKSDSAKKVEKKAETEEDDSDLGYINVCHLFLRQDLRRPFCYFPTDKFCHAVRFCPIRYKLDSPEDIETDFPYPYRIIFAIATQSSVILYDSSQLDPFGYISDIHYTRISDLSWSPDGRLLMISSTDGFCTFVTFEEGELGEPYEGATFNWEPELKEPANISDEAMEEIFSTVIANALATQDSNSCHAEESEEKMEEGKVEAGVDANSVNPAKQITPKTPSIASIFTKVPKSEGLKKTFNSTLFTSPIIPASSKRKENGSIGGEEEVIIIDEDSLGKSGGRSSQEQCQSPQVKKLKDSNGNAAIGSGGKKPIEVKKSTPPLFATYSRKVTDNGSRVLGNERKNSEFSDSKNLEFSGSKSNENSSNCGFIIIDDNLPSPTVPSTLSLESLPPSAPSIPPSAQSNELKSPLKSDQKKPIVPRRVSFITLTKPKEN